MVHTITGRLDRNEALYKTTTTTTEAPTQGPVLANRGRFPTDGRRRRPNGAGRRRRPVRPVYYDDYYDYDYQEYDSDVPGNEDDESEPSENHAEVGLQTN